VTRHIEGSDYRPFRRASVVGNLEGNSFPFAGRLPTAKSQILRFQTRKFKFYATIQAGASV